MTLLWWSLWWSAGSSGATGPDVTPDLIVAVAREVSTVAMSRDDVVLRIPPDDRGVIL